MKIELRENVAVLVMNAGKANAISPEWMQRFAGLLDELERSPGRAVVVTGYESFFCAGLDLPSLVDLSPEAMKTFMAFFSETLLRLFTFPRPVVAAVNGHAVAGGCVVALQADERIMADGNAKIGLNEVALGVGLPELVIETLRCQVPASSLGPIALEGKLSTPREAQALGLVREVVPAAECLDRAVARARELGAFPGPAFAQIKRALREPVARAVRADPAGDAERWVATWTSPEGQERVKAAVAKLAKRK